eukprot:scaffold60067_cov62-Phaeocystis_antarctica.AAC.3
MSGGPHASAADEVCVRSAEGEDASIAEPSVKCLDELPEEMIDQVVKSTDTSALCDLKAVGKAWCPRARHELSARLCSHSGGPTNDATYDTLNVEVLWATGRPHGAAGRELPNLAWLHGRTCAAVPEGTQRGFTGFAVGRTRPARLLHSERDSLPPRELLLVALAGFGSGSFLSLPVQRLRDGNVYESGAGGGVQMTAFGTALFNNADGCAELDAHLVHDADGIQLLALLLPGSKVERLKHAPRPEPIRSVVMLVTILLIERPANRSMGSMRGGVCGIDYRGRGTYTTEGITKLFEGLKRSKTTCLMCAVSPYHMFASSFDGNSLCGLAGNADRGVLPCHRERTYTVQGITKLCVGLKGSAITSLRSPPNRPNAHGCARDVLSECMSMSSMYICSLLSNKLCGVSEYHDYGTYTDEGITELCEGIKDSAITSLKCATARALLAVGYNKIGPFTAVLLATVLGQTITNLKCGIAYPTVQPYLLPNLFTRAGRACLFHPPPALSLRLAACSLEDNDLGPEGGELLAAVLPQTKITELKCVPPAPTPYQHPQPVSFSPVTNRMAICARTVSGAVASTRMERRLSERHSGALQPTCTSEKSE